jgi:hypothetical protein
MMARISVILAAVFLLLAAPAQAQTISSLPQATLPLSGSELLALVQGGATKKATANAILGTLGPSSQNSNYFPFGSGLYPQYETATTTTANTVMGSPDITVASVANISIGNVISSTSPGFVPAPGNLTYVIGISGTTVTLSDNATASLTGASVTFGVDRFDAGNTVFTNVLASRNGYFGAAAQGRSTWVAKYWSAGDFPIDHALFAVAETGGIQAALEATHTAGAPFGYVLNNGMLLVDDDGSVQHFSQANYVQSNLVAYAPGSTHIQSEMNVNSTAYPYAAVDPYTTNVAGMTENLRLDCGSGFGVGGNNCSTAIHVINNGAKYGVGMVFDSLSVAADISGVSSAIQFPKDYALDWFSASPGNGWRMYSTNSAGGAKAVVMTDSALTTQGANINAGFEIGPSAAGGRAVVAHAPTAGASPAGLELWSGSVFGAYFISDAQNFASLQTAGAWQLVLGANATTQITMTPAGGVQIGAPTGGDKGADTLNVKGAYYADGTLGVTCSGSPTSSFASVNGIVTHC